MSGRAFVCVNDDPPCRPLNTKAGARPLWGRVPTVAQWRTSQALVYHHGQARNLRQTVEPLLGKEARRPRAFSSFRSEPPESPSSPSVSSQQVEEKLSKRTLTVPSAVTVT